MAERSGECDGMWLRIATSGGRDERTVQVGGPEVLIGRGPECELVLEGESVFRQHARLIHAGNHYFLITKRDENGDIEPVIRDTLNKFGTHYHWGGRERRVDTNPFEIGEFILSVSGPPDDLVDRRPISLSIGCDGSEPFKTIHFAKSEVLIGSGPECDLVLEGEGIFRQHARVVRSINAFLLVKKRGENGEIEPVLRDTKTEEGSYYHADGRNIVVDNDAFEIGRFSVRVISEL